MSALHSPAAMAAAQLVIDRANAYPFVVALRMSDAHGLGVKAVHVVQAKSADDIDDEALVPAGHSLHRTSVFPIEYLHKMPLAQRPGMAAEYRAYVQWRQLRSGRPAIDYVQADEDVQNWLRPGRYVGD